MKQRIAKCILAILALSATSGAQPTSAPTRTALASSSLITAPLATVAETELLDLDGLKDEERAAALARIRELPKLRRLELRNCDLRKVDAKDPVPDKVTYVILGGCDLSQGTIRWLAKFPAGSILVLGNSDLRGLELSFGHFRFLQIENCDISPAAVIGLVNQTTDNRLTEVVFKELAAVKEK